MANATLLACLGSYVSRIVSMPADNAVAMSFCDGTLRVYDASSGALRTSLPAHKNAVHGLAVLGPDTLASGDASGLLCVWRVSTGACLFRQKHANAQVWMIVTLDSSRFVASIGQKGLKVFQHIDGDDVRCVGEVDGGRDCVLHLGVCGDRMVTASFNEKVAKVWDVASLKQVAVLEGAEGRELGLQLVAINDVHIVSAERKGETGVVSVWDAASLELLHKIELEFQVSSPVMLDERHLLLSSADDTLLLLDLVEGRVVYRLKVPLTVSHITLTDDGRLILAGSNEYALMFPMPVDFAEIMARSAASPFPLAFAGERRSENLGMACGVDGTPMPMCAPSLAD